MRYGLGQRGAGSAVVRAGGSAGSAIGTRAGRGAEHGECGAAQGARLGPLRSGTGPRGGGWAWGWPRVSHAGARAGGGGSGLAWPGGGAERLRCGKGSGGGGSCAGLPNDAPVPQCAQADDWRSAKSIYDFHALDIDGNDVSLDKYR